MITPPAEQAPSTGPGGSVGKTEPQVSPTEARIGEGAQRFSHSGYRYILGYGTDFFGIWDREAPGGPALRFPRTDDGWSEAWNRFSAMEPKAMTVQASGTPAPDLLRRSATGQYRSARGQATATMALLGVCAVLAVIAAAFWASHAGAVRDVEQDLRFLPSAEASERRADNLLLAVVFLVVPTGIAWLTWQYRAHTNLRALGAEDLRWSPGWAVAWWFIPLANVVMPFVTMRELWRGSDPEAGAVGWRMSGTTPLLGLWWGGWLVAQVLVGISNAVVSEFNPTYSELVAQSWLLASWLFVMAIVAVLAILVVRGTEARLTAKASRVQAWSSPTGVRAATASRPS